MLQYAGVPEDAGISSLGVQAFLDGVERQKLDFHSVMLLRQGKVACRLVWQPYASDTPHTLFSLSKSFCSCAAGLAVAEGLLRYDDKVAVALADKVPPGADERIGDITLHHLLSMSSGLAPESDKKPTKADWCRNVLSHPVVHEPGTVFHYNTLGTYLVSAMVQRATGQTVRDYLMPRLFEPLGIQKPAWDSCPMGISAGGYGLHLSCEDIAKFALLLKNDGIWQGKRLLPEGWVDRATARIIKTADQEVTDWDLGYGYQFWRTREDRFRGDGMYGQLCLVDQKNDLALAVTAGISDMGAELDLLRDTLLKAWDMPPAPADVQLAVERRCGSLGYPWPADDGTGRDITGSYMAPGGRRLRIDLRPDGSYMMHHQVGGFENRLCFIVSRGAVHRGECLSPVPGEGLQPYLGAYGWQQGKLLARVRMPEAPYAWLADIEPAAGGLRVVTAGAGVDAGTYLYKEMR